MRVTASDTHAPSASRATGRQHALRESTVTVMIAAAANVAVAAAKFVAGLLSGSAFKPKQRILRPTR